MKKSGIVLSQRGIGHTRINRALAMFMCLLMLVGLMPTQALAALADGETVISVSAPAKLDYEVDTGTELADAGLPGELSVSILVPAAEGGGESTTREETAAVKWTGDYDKDKPGSYTLTAAFTGGYSFDGSMPAVTVTVLESVAALAPQSEPEAVSLMPEKLNVNADDLDNDLAKVPDFYTPVLEKEEDTETALFSFTDKNATVQYRIYGSCGELIGFFVCQKDGNDPVTSDTVNESKDRALLPAADVLPVAESEPVKECTCDPKPGEGEAHQEDCPLYAAPEAAKECTCDPNPGEGEAHQEGCPLYVAPPAPLSEKADAFVQAVNALGGDAILAAVKAHVDASAAADAEPDNEELKKVAAEAEAAMEAATAPITAAFELYAEVPLDEFEHEQVVAALNKLNELATAVETAMNAEPTLLGTLGGTAPKLDGDWAYLTKFEILDDPTTTVVEGIMDGSGPFDTDTDPNSWTYKDRQGNDENDQNGKVRSFDTITYKLNYATATSGEYGFVKEGWMNYEMVLPYAAARAVWQTDSMAWVGTKVADQAALDGIQEQTSGYFLTTETRQGVLCQVLRGKFWIAPNESNPYAIPGEGTLSAVVQVLAMEEGDEVKPSFSAWMEHNTTDQTTCGTHQRAEIINFTAPQTTVTAEVRMDIELAGDANSMVDTIDFSAAGTSASAPNYSLGNVVGKPITYNVGVYLGNSVAGKGRKGIMAPKSGDTLTFDLTLSESVTPTGGTEIDLDTTNYKQLLWAFGSNDKIMDWYGRPPILGGMVAGWVPANTAFDAFTVGNNACYNGGAWSYTIDPTNSNIIHVTISGMAIDLANYPHTNISENRNFDVIGAIPISSGQMTTVFPIVVNGTNLMEDTTITGSAIGSGTIAGSIVDSNMSYTYVSKTDNQSHTLTNANQTRLDNDWSGYSVYAEKGGGTYDSHVMWSNAPLYGLAEWIHNVGSPMGDTTGGKYYLSLGGDPVVRNQSIGSWFGFYHQNDVPGDGGTIVAGNSLLKFDTNAVTPTGSTVLQVTGYSMTALYATKQDGTAWASDDEMESTSMTELKYYLSLSAIPSGHKCVAVLTEYRPTDADYTGVPASRQHLYSDAGLTVNADAVEGALYQCTIENYAWSRDAYEALGKSIPSLLNASTLPAESWHWQPDYNKGVVEFHGRLVGDTSGFRWGDVMQVIAGKSAITKEVAQQENGVNKSVYYMDSDQRFVDYKLNVSTEYVTYNVATTPTGITTTLKILDGMNNGLTYVPNSAYYGGTYTQNPIPGRQGTVTGGTPLTLIASYPDGQYTWYEFEIPNVEIGKPLQPIYLTAKIGTRGVESTDVYDGQKILNISHAQIGKEITTTREDNGDMGLASIIISKNGATSRSKLADQTYIENGDAFNWTINIGNNGGTAMPNALALDTLPYVNDGQGTTFTGTLSLSKWNVDVTSISNFTAANWQVMYTEDINVRGTVSSQYRAADVKNGDPSGPNNVVFTDITTLADASIDYDTGVVTLPANFRPTAMVVVGTLPGNQTMKIAAQMNITNGKQGDILVNQLDGYPSPIYVVKRSIEGCTWLDTDHNGIRKDEETMLSGVTATLLKLKEGGDATDEADYEVVKDGSNNDVKVETGKQKDAVTGTQTDYDAGRYQFTNLVPGTYAVRFTSGTVILDNYTASKVNEGTDDTKDSDAKPTYNAAGDKLEKTVILGIVMAKASDQMKDINQASRNNDSGLYLYQFALTVSKTVTTGSQTKDFTFTVYLANGTTPLTGKFDYTGSAISGVDKPANGSITLSGGSAEITLKHGQSIIIGGIPAGTTYTVTEQAPGTGWTITAPATGSSISGTLNGPATAAFTNSYKALSGTSAVPAVTKTLTGTLHTGFTATFSASIAAVSTTASGLTVDTMPMPATTTASTPAFTATGTQSFASFGSISYSAAGKYVYRITENTSSVAGVTCDKSEYNLTVDVTDVNGQLTATQTITQIRNAAGVAITDPTTVTAPINFANSYAPKSTAVTVVAPGKQLVVTEGNALPTGYSETFTATIEATTTGAPMPANASVNTDAFTATGNKSFASFGSITFTAAGTYEYTIKESTPAAATATPGMTYDKSEYKLSVEVVDDNGQLKATPTYTRVKSATGEAVNEPVSSITFTNRYTPAAVTLTSGAIKVRKTLSGDVLPTAAAFSFTLKHTPTTEGPAAGLSIAAPTTISTAAITQGTNVPTTADFGTITFNRVGTYTFTVTEEKHSPVIPSLAYADPQTVYVKVTDNAGQLAAAFVDADGNAVTNGGTLTFTNTYNPTDATLTSATLDVVKTLSGHVLPSAKAFTFTLALTSNNAADVTMPDPATVTTTAISSGSSAAVGFGDIIFKKVGEYTFSITETASGVQGMTDASPQYVTVEVTDNGGALEAKITSPTTGGHLTFINTYSPNPSTVTSAALNVTKTIGGIGTTLPTPQTFTFTLARTDGGADADVVMPTGTGLTATTAPITTGSADPVGFGDITFNKAGIYSFSITETTTPAIPGLAYADPQTVYIKITDNNGTLTPSFVDKSGNPVATGGGALTFTNTYTPTTTDITDAQLNVKKTIGGVGGRLPAEYTFEFTLARTDNGAPAAVTMPTGTGLTATTAPIATGTSASVGFGKITFHAAGTYTFSITEERHSPVIPGVAYAGPQTVTVKVTDTNGVLSAAIVTSTTDDTPASGELTFTNTYTPTDTTLTSAALNVKKTVAGHILPEAKTFTFTLTRTDGGAADAVVLPAQTSITTEAIRFGDATVIGFDAITFKAAGTYTFSIAESVTGITGMTDAPAQTVTVKVTDTDGVLSAAIVASTTDDTPTSGALTFTNTYKPQSVVATDPPVEKIVTGVFTPDTDETFTFLLTPISYTAPIGATNTMTPAEMPISADREITITGSGTKEFGPYTYTMAGTYVYTITEKAGTNQDYSYDGSTYTYTDVVTDTNGALSFTRTMTKPGVAPNPTVAVFTNTYTRPMGTLVVSKTVTGGGNPNALFTFRFTFSEATRYDYVKSDGTTGTIATGESLQLKHGESVTITIHHKVTYTVVEDAYMSYIPTPAGRTFMGTISATESRADYENVFDLPYIPPTPTLTGNLTVQKTVTGDLGDRNKDFAFKIVFDAPGSYYYTGTKTGMITSGDTILLRHGEYITIVNLPAGTTYSVTESGNSGYRVYASGDVGIIAANRISVAAFTNSRSKVPITGDDGSLFKGLMLMLISLVGGAVLLLADQRLKRRRRRARVAR